MLYKHPVGVIIKKKHKIISVPNDLTRMTGAIPLEAKRQRVCGVRKASYDT